MLDNLTTGQLNSKYTNIHFENYLSEGGQKRVYKGKLDSRDVAIKLIPTESDSFSKRAEREVKCMQEVVSDNLVTLIDCFKDVIDGQNVVVIIEEYIDGVSLRDIIDDSPSLDLALDTLETLLKLLEKFDKTGIVHRDIKPENIIIRNNGDVVLLDFGIARLLNKTSITASVLPIAPGTIAYSAPEQLHNKKELQNVRTDLFSCGIVFFETATGTHPFESTGSGDLIESIQKGDRKKMSIFFPNNPVVKLIDELFIKLTNPHLHERYRKPKYALDMINKIREVLNDKK